MSIKIMLNAVADIATQLESENTELKMKCRNLEEDLKRIAEKDAAEREELIKSRYSDGIEIASLKSEIAILKKSLETARPAEVLGDGISDEEIENSIDRDMLELMRGNATLEQFKKVILLRKWVKHKYNMSKTGDELGILGITVNKWIKELGVDKDIRVRR